MPNEAKRLFAQRINERLLPALQKQKILTFVEAAKIMGLGRKTLGLDTFKSGILADLRRKGVVDFGTLSTRGVGGRHYLVVPKLKEVVGWARVSGSSTLPTEANGLLKAAQQAYERKSLRKRPLIILKRGEAEPLIRLHIVKFVPGRLNRSFESYISQDYAVCVKPDRNFDAAVHLLNRALILNRVRPSRMPRGLSDSGEI
jgi:hypothetical protein